MRLNEVFASTAAWGKLSAVNMKPSLAYKILKYTRQIQAEFDIAEKQRVALVREISNTPVGDVKIEPDTPEFEEYVRRFTEVLETEIDLNRLGVKFSELLSAVEDKDESLSPADLALLEPFFES